MKLKYFLRGLGSGIVITTLILTISFNGKIKEISEEKSKTASVTQEPEVTQSITPTIEAEVTESVAPTKEAKATESVTPAEEAEATESVTATPEPTVTKEPTATVAPTEAPTATAEPTATATVTTAPTAATEPGQAEKKTLTIVSGMWSDKVAEELQKLGIIQDAADFDRYLIRNGYADKIKVGTFEIPMDASYEQIAKTITGR